MTPPSNTGGATAIGSRRTSTADIKVLLPEEMFTKLDRMAMAHGLEGRVPLVDYRIVELAARIPSRMKLKRGEVKAILKKSMRERLPREVLTRYKVGFRAPFNEWFRGPLRTMVYDLLTDASFRQAGIFNPKAVTRPTGAAHGGAGQSRQRNPGVAHVRGLAAEPP